MQLRPYQQQALEAVRESYRNGHRRALVVMPTGTGKTVLFAEIARLAKGPVLVVAHRQELVDQARDKIAAWCDDVVAVEMAEQRGLTAPAGQRPKITVASVQTLQRRLAQVPRDAFKILVIDEAHHGVADSYRALIDHFDAWLLGVTATPDRADRRPLGDVFSDVSFDYDMQAAIRDGWLCPIRSFLVETEADFSNIRKIAGELATKDVERELTKEPHLVEVAQPIFRERGDRPAMVFAASVAHAHALCRVLNRLAGDDPNYAAAVDGSSPREYRSETVQRFRDGEIRVLVNCSLFTEGFDVPQVALVAIARPVLSRAFYAQMVGRGTRLSPGKEDLLVLDFVPGNCRHQLVQAVDIFSDEDPDVVERARGIAAKASEEGSPLLLEQALELARQEFEAEGASVSYRLRPRDPFAAVGLELEDVGARAAHHDRTPITAEQRKYLLRAGIDPMQVDRLTEFQATELQEALRERKAVGLCTPKQAFELAAYGVNAREMYHDEARELLRYIRKERKTRSDASIRHELRGTGRASAECDEA